MQLRYLGDSHDYFKFALLRHLQKELNVRIGVNWYLTKPEGNQDGEQRHHMNGQGWERLDPELLKKLENFQSPVDRTLERFERSGILRADTLFWPQHVQPKDNRQSWHNSASDVLSAADLIFLDPDNGFQVQTMFARNQQKYALYEEACHYARLGKIVVSIQFARQCDPLLRAKSVRQKLTQDSVHAVEIPVVRCRISPNILFLIVAPNDRVAQVIQALVAYEANSPVHKRNQKRIEIIR